MIPPLTRAVLHLGLSTTEAVLDRALTVVRLADTLLVAGARDNAAAGRGTSPWPAEDEGDLAAVSLRLGGDEETETPNTPARKTVAKAAARKTTTRKTASKSTPRKTAAKTTARKAATTVTGTSTANKAAAARTTPAKTPGQNAAAAKTSAKKTPARSSAKAAATGAAKNAEKGRTPRQTTPRSEA